MALFEIEPHDARIKRVIEIAESHDLLFEVEYVVDWEHSRYEPRVIAFRDVLQYRIDEIPFRGAPVILEIQNAGEVEGRMRLLIVTNAGERWLLCADVELLKS